MTALVDSLEQLNRDIGVAEKGHDARALDRILGDSLLFRRASGRVVTKSTYLADLPNTSYDVLESEIVEIDEKQDSAVATVLVTAKGTRPDGQPFAGRFRNVRLFVKESDEWRCSVWINTPLG